MSFKRVFVDEEPIVEGNGPKAAKNDYYYPQTMYQKEYQNSRQMVVPPLTDKVPSYSSSLARSYPLTNYDTSYTSIQGFQPGVNVRRIELDGNIHWSDNGMHTQEYDAFGGEGALISPNVFLALVHDSGVQTDYLDTSEDPQNEIPFPHLDPYQVWNMHGAAGDPLDTNTVPQPWPQPSTRRDRNRRYTTIWSKSFIPSQDPEHTYETLREEQDPPYPLPPTVFKREFRWLPRTIFFKVALDVDCTVAFQKPPLTAQNVAGSILCGSAGNIFMIVWNSGGRNHRFPLSIPAQVVYLTYQLTQFFDLNKS